MVLGVAIPLGLGLVHALYTIALWATLAVCIGLSHVRRCRHDDLPLERVPYLLIAALVVVAWPQLVRPLLDGDSLWYHLPNATSWVQAHSLWTTTTHYWWYPPASELFASGLYAASTPFALPWCGFVALALLGFRVAAWTRELGASPWLADAMAAATVTVYPLAIEGGTLQNDVWLAAFWLEALWLLGRRERGAAMQTIALTVLLKPQGWILGAIALVVRKAPVRVWLAGCAALAFWVVHDALLWQHAGIPPSSTMGSDLLASTMLANIGSALPLLARTLLHTSPFALLALCAALLGPLIEKDDRGLGWGACLATLLVLILPFGSIRFAAPAIAAGALVLAMPARRRAIVSTVLAIASAVFGISVLTNIFWNDGSTRSALAVAPIVALLALLARTAPMLWINPLIFAALVTISTHDAARHPVDYYRDALGVNGNASGIYQWFATTRPEAIGGWGLRLGAVNVLSPSTRTIDLLDTATCAQARANRTLLVAVEQSDRDAGTNAARLRAARGCGTVLYDDRLSVVAKP